LAGVSGSSDLGSGAHAGFTPPVLSSAALARRPRQVLFARHMNRESFEGCGFFFARSCNGRKSGCLTL
jgi:hypothetical protein